MKKLITLGLAIFSATSLLAQTYEFGLNKALTVGCYNANPLIDKAKKVDLKIDGQTGTLTIASLNCKKDIVGISLGVVNESTQGTMYFDEKEKKGFIIEKGEKIILFDKEDNAYKVSVIGHIDKKLAKTLNSDADQANYVNAFAKIEGMLADAKKKADVEKKMANTLPVPSGNYSDKYGISGLYYLSEPVEISENSSYNGETKYAQAVQLEFIASEKTLKIHYAEGKFDVAYINSPRVAKGIEDGSVNKVIFFNGNNMNKLTCFDDRSMTFLEDGSWFLSTSSDYYIKLDCSGFKFQSPMDQSGKPKIKYVIMSKTKEKANELVKNTEKTVGMLEKAAINNCELDNALEAALKPMPSPGLKDAKLNAEATAAIKEYAAGKWAQEVVYVYVTGTDWYTIRNSSTGLITGRSIRAVAVLKTTTGKCQWEEVSIKQDYNGAEYGKSQSYGNSSVIVPVDCNAAMKYKQ
jgi:hypothetical protein